MSNAFPLHHSISSVIIYMLFVSCATCQRPTNIWNLLTYTDRNHPSPMQRVVVHNSTKDVYISARNALYHFSSDLRVKRIISTGPETDSAQCLHPSYPCAHNRTIIDNDNKVLEIFQSSSPPLLLACGTLYQGLCLVQSLGDISRRTWVKPFNDSVGFISGRGSTVAFFAQGYNNQTSLYSASTYDGRPLSYSPVSVSSKVIVRGEDGIEFKYSHETDTSFTGVNFKLKENYKVEYIAGFGYGDFAYFLTTQKVSVESEAIETRLARVCMNDPSFFSYTEVPLKCHVALDIYNLATAAHLGVASAQLKRRLKLDKFADVLYVSFVRTVPDHGRLVDRSRGSVICSFPMSIVIASFTNATRDCFKAQPRAELLKHVTGVKLDCVKKDDVEVHDYFCGSAFNHYIAGMESIPGGFRNNLDAHITSLATTLQNSRTIAIAGTDTGDIIKVDMDKRERSILYTKNIAEDQEDKRIQSSNAFDPRHENIYFLVGKKAVKFPIGSCSLYTDCHSCLTMEDPLMCGWCGNHCSHFDECETPDIFSTNTCAPIIFDVTPLKGPTEGGTIVTVSGDNFGSSHKGEDVMQLSITVAGVPCELLLWENEKVQCRTKAVTEIILPGAIEISVSDSSWNIYNYNLNGTTTSQDIFTYLTPVLYGIYPGKGPISGGTNMTLYGSTLDIGYSITIKVAGIPCKEINIRQDVAWCITGDVPGNSSKEAGNSRVGPVELHIDDAVVEIEHQIAAGLEFDHPISQSFVYLPDPEILSIDTEATTVSGIKNLIIKGKHLNSVESPRMVVNVASSVTGESLQVVSDPCWFNDGSTTPPDGSTMICPTPALHSSTFHAPTERAPLVTHVAFLMDGVEKLRQLPKYNMELSKLLYYPDPEFDQLSENGQVMTLKHDQTYLEIKGKYLNLALDESDVKVFFDNVTACTMIEMTSDSISCAIPPLEEFQFNNVSMHSVTVLIGSLVFPLGVVEFIKDVSTLVSSLVMAMSIIIAAALAVYFLYRCYFRGKKNYPDYRITFTYNNTQPETCNGGITRQPSNCNDYQDWPGRRRQNSVAAGAAAASIPEETCQRSASMASVDDETIHLLQSQNILVPRNYLSLGEVIGEGHFGCVYKGELLLPGKESKLEVAVKTLHNTWSNLEQDSEAFLQEGLMMKDFHHHNVLTLIGVCFDGDGSPMVIIPFMKHGDLLSYIRSDKNSPSVKELMTYGVQIAAGMKYLAEIKFVHRDLAARNCMMDDDKTVKVADFGLSRDIYERDYYSSDNKKTKLPIKWMAPESIEKGTYTTKSDVWSYGVVLWELLTRGVAPYPGVDNWDILQYIKLGRRMPQPSYCPDALYAIMQACWDEDPKKRPTFAELEEQVHNIIKKLERKCRQRTVGLNVTYVNYPHTLAKEAAAEPT